MKVVVLTGPESAGKSTLCEALAQHYKAPLVGEYVREFIDKEQRDTHYEDVTVIAQQQLENELRARAQRPPLLILDTHLLSNMIWSETLFKAVPEWLEEALLAQHYDLIALLSPEGMAWQEDGMRCQPLLKDRQAFHARLLRWLTEHQQPVVAIHGHWQERLQQLISAIDRLLA